MALRPFVDDERASWRVWDVDAFHWPWAANVPRWAAPNGEHGRWLAFFCDESPERRRLYEVPPDWALLDDPRLALCARARSVLTPTVPPLG